MQSELVSVLGFQSPEIGELIRKTQDCRQKFNDALQNGRDRLLEYNSCRTEIANDLKVRGVLEEKTSNLQDYMEIIFDCFGVASEIRNEFCFVLTPGNHMLRLFPGLPDDGITIT